MEMENTSGQRPVTLLEICGVLTWYLAVKTSNMRMPLDMEGNSVWECAAATALDPFQLPVSTDLCC